MKTFNELFFHNFLKVLTAIIIILSFLYILKPFLVAIVFGGIFAMAFSPMLGIIMQKWKLGRPKSVLIMVLGMFFLGGVPFIVFCIRGSKLISNFFTKQSFSELTNHAQDKVYTLIEKMGAFNTIINTEFLKEKFIEVLNTVSGFIFKMFSDLIASIPDLVITSIVLSVSFCFFLLKEEKIRTMFDKYFFFQNKNGSLFIKRIKTSCREVFLSNVITGTIQSSIIALGALFCGIGDFYITFIITFIFSFIPVLGAGPMGFLLGAVAFIDGRIGVGITMCVIGLVSGVTDNLIRPYLNSRGEVEVPGVVGFVSVIGGVIMLGLPGLFIGPLLASLMFGSIPIILDEYFPETRPEDETDHVVKVDVVNISDDISN